MNPTLALVNNYDDPLGGPNRRIERLLQWNPDLQVFDHHALQSDDVQEKLNGFDGVILSGSYHNISEHRDWGGQWIEDQARFVQNARVPVLGICYGHELVCHAFGADVGPRGRTTNGYALLELDRDFALLPEKRRGHRFLVSHRYEQEVKADTLPSCLKSVASAVLPHTESAVQVVAHENRAVFGVQFHPETLVGADPRAEAVGRELLDGFAACCRSRAKS